MDATSPTARLGLTRLSAATCGRSKGEFKEAHTKIIIHARRSQNVLTSEASFDMSSPSSSLLSIVMTSPSADLALELLLVFLDEVVKWFVMGDGLVLCLKPFLSLFFCCNFCCNGASSKN
jgi:hypothetical protein